MIDLSTLSVNICGHVSMLEFFIVNTGWLRDLYLRHCYYNLSKLETFNDKEMAWHLAI